MTSIENNIVEELTIDTLKPAAGSNIKKTRKGRGAASGHGRSCGRGRGGSGHRSGNSRKVSFEGGQMPLVRRMPKRGFSNAQFKKNFEIVNVGQLHDKFEDNSKITAESLKKVKLIKGKYPVKILGKGDISKKFTISGCYLSRGAKEKIEKAGGV